MDALARTLQGGEYMSIEQEKMIVESLSSLYPLQEFEEKAIDTVLNAIPHWIPVTERLPESKEEDLEYPTVLICFDSFIL